jgi:hypothetical protein
MKIKSNLIILLLVLFFMIISLNYAQAAISDAKPVQLNTPIRGSLQSYRTKNYYKIDLPSPGYIRIDFEHENLTESYTGWLIKLYDYASQEIEQFSSQWNTPEASSANIGLPAGTYYILVEAHSGGYHNNADYFISVWFNSSDYWEQELNDTILTATTMKLNQPYQGSLNRYRDKDYYEINLSSDGYIRIDFEHENLTESYTGWFIKLYDYASQEIEKFSSKWNTPEASSANIDLPAGTYYILVEAHSGGYHNNADYILTANFDVNALPVAAEMPQSSTNDTDKLPFDKSEVSMQPGGAEDPIQPFSLGALQIIVFFAAVVVIMFTSIMLIKMRSN